MTTRKATVLLLLISLLVMQTTAQRFTHRLYRHDWSDHVDVEIPVQPQFKDYGAVVLYEDVIISLVSPVFKRYARIKFQTQEGIDRFNDFVLPHPADPYYFLYHFPQERQDTGYFPVLAEDNIFYFDARILRKGELVKAVLDEKIYPFTYWNGHARPTEYAFRYYVRNLQPGDELEISYSHTLPGVHRYFFNEAIPKQESQVNVKIPYPLTRTVKMRNFVALYDSSENFRNQIPYRIYSYNMKNLLPVTAAFGQQSYKELPYLEFFQDRFYPDNASIIDGYPVPVKYTWASRMYYLSNYRPAFDYDFYRNKMDNATLTYNAVADSIFLPLKDSSLTIKVRTMQQTLLDDFTFANDFGYFTGQNMELETVYRNLGKKIIRERWAKETWYQLFYRLAEDYYHSYVPDKRLYQINPAAYSQPLDSNLVYAIQDNGQPHFVIPRFHAYGYYMDEFPFYFSDVPTFLIPQMVPETTYNRKPELIAYPIVRTTRYLAMDNRRITATGVRVNLDSGIVQHSSVIELGGQFSTMTRGAYLYHYRDSTVNKKYAQCLTTLPGAVTDQQVLVHLDKVYPFNCGIGIYMHSNEWVQAVSDTVYALNTRGWMNFVYQEELDTFYHHMAYYPDFAGEDHFNIRIECDAPVSVLNSADYIYMLDNSFARLTSTITRPQPDIIVLNAHYKVYTERVDEENLADVVAVFRALHKLAATKMLLSTQPMKN